MEYFWAIAVSIVLGLIIYGIISSRIQKRRPVSLGNIKLKKLDEVFDPGKRYDVVINSGTRFLRMKIVGFAEAVGGGSNYEVVWSSRRWLILEDPQGCRTFVSPYRIMWMREAEPVAPHEPPPRASASDALDDRTLDSLPAPGSSGGR